VRNAFQAVPAWTDHLLGNASLKARLDAVFGTAGLDAWASWCKVLHYMVVLCGLGSLDDHFFDALTARTCHGHPLPCSDTAGTCVSEADAASVFAIGDFEYECVLKLFALLVLFSSSPSLGLLIYIRYAATSGMRHKTRRHTIRLHLVKQALLSLLPCI
jgi:hypothetical protein